VKRVTGLMLTAAVLLAACQESGMDAEKAPSASRVLSGSITYRERMALTDRAVVEISLLDVSLADAPATVIAQQDMRDPGQVPIRFELPFPAEIIDPRRVYALQAKIFDRGELQFINDTRVPVLTRGANDRVRMTLVPVQTTPSADTP